VTPDDAELLSRMRAKHGNPYMPLSMAKEMAFQEAKYAHLGAIVEMKRQESAERERRRLKALVSGQTSGGQKP